MRALVRVLLEGASKSHTNNRDATTITEEDEANDTAVAPVLWLEQNLWQWVRQEFGQMAEDCLCLQMLRNARSI